MNSDSGKVSAKGYLTWEEETVTIKLKESRLQSRLRYVILTTKPAYLIVHLVDPKEGGLVRWFRGKIYSPLFGDGFSKQLKYPIVEDLPVCERVTQIIFQGIDSHLQEEITRAGQTEASVGLDYLFRLLRKDRLDSFMDKLGPIEKTCPDAFRLLKWIRNEEVHGFDFKEYAVRPELGSVLEAISKSLLSFKKWQFYDFRLLVIGYTDPVPVQAPDKSRFFLNPSRTGVKSLASRPRLDVRYRGCYGDHPVGTPQYIDFFSLGGQLVRSPIQDNCELGAVRAYSATAFLVEKLGRQNMQYEYTTGGISPSADNNDALKRKVDLKIIVKAATKKAATPSATGEGGGH